MVLPLILTAVWFGDAAASTIVAPGERDQAGSHAAGNPLLQLAQASDVEVYYDQYGRRVIVDAYTG
jgi:hypothetical protein